MMPKNKLALFEQFDFSKTGFLTRAGLSPDDPKVELYHDIAGMVQTLMLLVARVAETEHQNIKAYNQLQNEIYKCYGWLNLTYQGITWSELDADDPDFAVFYSMRQSIDNLGQKLNAFLQKYGTRLGQRIDSEESKNVTEQLKFIGQLMQKFRKTKERLKKQVAL